MLDQSLKTDSIELAGDFAMARIVQEIRFSSAPLAMRSIRLSE